MVYPQIDILNSSLFFNSHLYVTYIPCNSIFYDCRINMSFLYDNDDDEFFFSLHCSLKLKRKLSSYWTESTTTCRCNYNSNIIIISL